MSNQTKMIKVNEEDWSELNRYLSVLQIEKRDRLSFADAVHEIVKEYVKPYMERFMKASMRSES